jgi:hypothetical protein
VTVGAAELTFESAGLAGVIDQETWFALRAQADRMSALRSLILLRRAL